MQYSFRLFDTVVYLCLFFWLVHIFVSQFYLHINFGSRLVGHLIYNTSCNYVYIYILINGVCYRLFLVKLYVEYLCVIKYIVCIVQSLICLH